MARSAPLDPFLQHVGQAIGTLRRRRGWSQELLGQRLGMTAKAVAKFESGTFDLRLQCECGGKRSLVALIQQPVVIKKVLVHLDLPTDLVTRGEPPVVSVRGPPTALFPWDVSEAGELLHEADEGPPADAADLDLPLFADDLAA